MTGAAGASNRAVLDASAVLALLADEPGADDVETLLDGSAMSTVNVSEVLQKSIQHGIETEGLEYDLQGLGVDLYPFDVAQATPEGLHAKLASEMKHWGEVIQQAGVVPE